MEYEAHTAENGEAPLSPPGDEAIAESAPTPTGETAEEREEAAKEAAPAEEAATAPAAEEMPDYARIEREDLAALAAAYPTLSPLSSLAELDDPVRYGELRELGLAPKEAFLAVGGGRLLARGAQDTRAHLATAVGRAAAPAGGRLSAGELAAARDLFPSLSDGEIEALYRRVEHPRHRP